ncbi:MAG: isoprenylcysteine carboxylmethyltransferase family protein [Elusimicrobia bacterium]|nr:isoprenylcysteine carboxylmethyltransferase family protein [Elusimicrobiota bacterium]
MDFETVQETFWVRHRRRVAFAAGLFCLLLAHPRSRLLFLCGLLLAILGEMLRLWAAGCLHKGRELSREGPYAWVRHPLYLGALCMMGGSALVVFSLHHPGQTALVWAVLLWTWIKIYPPKMILEERHLTKLYGEEYAGYCRRVPRLFPGWPRGLSIGPFQLAQLLRNREHQTVAALWGVAALLWMKLIYRL